MSIIYGYARCSTSELRQDIDRQKRELLKLGVSDDAHIYREYESGSKTNRPELTKLLSAVQSGDNTETEAFVVGIGERIAKGFPCPFEKIKTVIRVI